MSLGEADPSKDRGREVTPFAISCSICLDAVRDGGDRSRAKLQCGHEFHLDCIGSAFNAKGVMQCPNCRKTEKGQWLYANGHRSVPELSMDEWAPEDDLYDLSYSEMPFGVRWCPFISLTQLTTFEEGESTTAAYNDLLGHHAILAEHTSASSAVHSCPYVPFFQPLQSPSSNSSESVTGGPTFHHWAGLSGPDDITTSHAFRAVDFHYNSWDHMSPAFSPTSSRTNNTDRVPVSSAMARLSRAEFDGVSRTGAIMHPFFVDHGSSSRAGSSVFLPPFLSNSQAQAQAQAQARTHAHGVYSYHRQPNLTAVRASVLPSARRSTGRRGSGPIGSAPSSSDQPGFYFIPAGSSGRNIPDAESNAGSQFYAWERDRLSPHPLVPIGSDLNWWAQTHRISGGLDSSSSRAEFLHGHGLERLLSQGRTENSYQPVNHPRMHPFF